jgi:hypothetical protein
VLDNALDGALEDGATKAGPITGAAAPVTALEAAALARPSVVTPPQVTAPAAGAAQPTPKPAASAAPPETTSAPPEVPSLPISPQALDCAARGGTWGRVGDTIAYSCFRPTRDAGKSCRRQTDCETECLARSRSCAPITPMIGCNPVLQADGREVTLCID